VEDFCWVHEYLRSVILGRGATRTPPYRGGEARLHYAALS
jgi:hypothetical protein